MAEVRPFRGMTYAADKVSAKDVLAPPYDVIDEAGRGALASLSPHNAVHLILPEGDESTRYDNAAGVLSKLQSDGVLRTSERPALYRYHQSFAHPERAGQTATRRGFLAAVRLHEFSERVILPHERTLSGPKVDRLNLMRATSCHTSPIFGLYSDPSGEGERLLERYDGETPILDGVTEDGTRHQVWEVTDQELIGELQRLLAPLSIYIADGHHRYETMLAYRNELRAAGHSASDSAAEYGMMFLANMDDPGMIVLPTHRQVHSVADFSASDMLKACEGYFTIRAIERSVDGVRSALAGLTRPGFAVAVPGNQELLLLSLRDDAEHSALQGAVGTLDVSALHGIVFEEILGVDKAAQAAKTNIRYIKDTETALGASEEGQATFLLRATTLPQVRAVSDAGEFMPQKSTFFVPKLASGVVYRPIDPAAPVA